MARPPLKQHLRSLGRPLVVFVCGDRKNDRVMDVWWALDGLHAAYGVCAVVHGASGRRTRTKTYGVDLLAEDWAAEVDTTVAPYPADWERHGRRAGYVRTQALLSKERPDLLLALPGPHTDMVVDQVLRRHIRVWRYIPKV